MSLLGVFGIRKKLKFNAQIVITDKGFLRLNSPGNDLEANILSKVTDSSQTVGAVVRQIQQENPRVSMRGILQTIEHAERKGFIEITEYGEK